LRINYRFRRSPPFATGRSLVRVGALGLCNVGAVIAIDTYYDTLGVSPDADDRDIRMAFRRFAKQFHPDFNAGDADAARCFKEISCAYKVLRDARTRAAYDAHLEELRAVVARDRTPAAAAGFTPRRRSWREARRMAASCLVASIGVVAFAMYRNADTLVGSAAIIQVAPGPAPAVAQPTPSPSMQQARADRVRSVSSGARQVLPSGTPEPAVAPAPQRDGESLAQATRLVKQGERYLAQGNVAIARGYFERAADLGLPAAAMRMAETYDPVALAARGAFGPKADMAEVWKWYERAADPRRSLTPSAQSESTPHRIDRR